MNAFTLYGELKINNLSQFKSGLRDAESSLKSTGKEVHALESKANNLGSTFAALRTRIAGGLAVGLTTLGALGTKSALDLDSVRTKIKALVGDSETAGKKIQELFTLSKNSVGVLPSSALDTFAQLKGIGGIADETINKLITSMGKLNAAFNIEDMQGFNRNLVQIFSQGFERSDIKEAIGRVPIFEQLMSQAFGGKNVEQLKAMKASGKLTLDQFLSGMSEAIASDSRIANVGESLSVKVAKSMERLNIALAPIGEIILNAVVPALEKVAPYVESAANWFA